MMSEDSKPHDRSARRRSFRLRQPGNLTSLKDQQGNTTTFGYDEFFRVTSQRDPLGRMTNFEHNAVSNVLAKVDRLIRRTTIAYDPLHRPQTVTYADAVVNYQYDPAGYCPEGAYFLNATIVDSSATLFEDGYISFQFLMTGGFDNESFMRSLIVTAKDFSLQ